LDKLLIVIDEKLCAPKFKNNEVLGLEVKS